MKLPQIYTHFHQGQVFTFQEAANRLGTRGNTLRKRLCDLAVRGYIAPIRQGLYRLSNLNKDYVYHEVSPFEIASKLIQNGYVGYQTALQFHAQTQTPKQHSIYLISQIKFNTFRYESRQYHWCQSSELYGIESYRIEENNYDFIVSISDFEKTILDCLKRPLYCRDFEMLVSLSAKSKNSPDFDKLMKYAEKLDVRSVYNRLGYLLEKQKEVWDIPNEILQTLERKMSRKKIEWHIKSNTLNTPKWKINFSPSDYTTNSR